MTSNENARELGVHEYDWVNWSAAETRRLATLPADELIIAIKTRTLDNLTDEDQAKVLHHLASMAGEVAVAAATTDYTVTRVPISVAGSDLPYGPSRRQRHMSLFVVGLVALALGGWGGVLAAGHAWLAGREIRGNVYVP